MTVITQAHLDALDQAIASGELTVSYQGRVVTYQSTDSLLKARAHIARLLQQAKPRAPSIGGLRYGLANFSQD